MPVVHIRPGGTKAATGPGDYASTAGDWSLANCYASLHQVGFSSVSGSPSTYIAADDEIILYSDVDAPVTHDLSQARLRDISVSGTVTIKSKDGDRDACILSSATAGESDLNFNNNDAANQTAFVIEDLTFTKSVAHTGTNKPLIYLNAQTSDVAFTRCRFTGYVFNAAINNISLNAIINSRTNGSAPAADVRTLTITDCLIDDITGTLSGTSAGGFKPGIYADDGTTLIMNGDNVIRDITLSQTQDNSGASFDGYILVTGAGASLTVNGTLTVEDTSLTVTNDDAANGAAIVSANGAPITINGACYFTRMTHTHGNAHAFGVHAQDCVFAINELHAIDCTVVNADADLGLGGTLLSQGTATGTCEYISAVRVACNNGAVFETSGGGSLTLKRFYANGCWSNGAAVYAGGDGDVVVSGGLITGTRYISAGSGATLDLRCMTNETTINENCTRVFGNITILNSDPAAGLESVRVRHVNTGATEYDMTVTFNNCVFAGGAEQEFAANEGSLTTLDLTLNNCGYGAAGDIDVSGMSGSGTFANNDPVVSASLGVNADGSLDADSPLIDAGLRWWTASEPRPSGSDGEPFPDFDISIGGLQSRAVPFHPLNL